MTVTESPPETPTIPHSREAEEAAIGAILINPNALYEINPFLKADDFYIHRHRWIYKACEYLDQTGQNIDMLTVTDYLDRKGLLVEVGGPAYLTGLINQVPSSLNAENYARIVQRHSIRRMMINSANNIAALAYNEKIEITEAVQDSIKEIAKLEVTALSKNNFITIGQLFSKVYDDVEQRSKDPKDVWGFKIGLPKFDKKTGGLETSQLIYLAGPPGAGKTWLDLGMSIELGKQAPGAVISLEMKQMMIGRRMLSGVTGVKTSAMKSGFVDEADFKQMADAIKDYENIPIHIDDSMYDTQKLKTTLAWMKGEYGIRWFTLDYALLLMDDANNETEQSKIISANLKRIVNDLDLCGIVLHSVTKIGMGDYDVPRMSDQRGSGQAIHDADLQMFLTPLYEKDSETTNLPIETKKKMVTLWNSKGREMEESKFRIHLIRKGNSPFWGEFTQPRY